MTFQEFLDKRFGEKVTAYTGMTMNDRRDIWIYYKIN